ncbi:MAG: DUF1295 domain-containing protein [Pseudomonadota bacterium]
MFSALLITYAVTCVAFIGIWLINVMTKNAGVIDYYWGPGFAVIGLIHLAMNGASTSFDLIFVGAIALWAFRLAQHLVRRHHAMSEEDGRYAAMRESGGPNFWWVSLFSIFLLQATLLWLIAAPVHVALGHEQPVSEVMFGFGMAIFVVGFAMEWLADRQLAVGKEAFGESERGGALFRSGLWGISRHPNYVGEMVLWWGLGVAAFAMSGNPIAFAGPILLCTVMIAISIPLTEQHMVRTRPAYRDYQKRVPMLINLGGRARSGTEAREIQ